MGGGNIWFLRVFSDWHGNKKMKTWFLWLLTWIGVCQLYVQHKCKGNSRKKINLSKFICIQKLLCDNKIIKKIRNNEISKA